jgi:hypothetical protein
MLSPPSIHSPRPRPPAPRRSTLPSPPPYESSLRSSSPLSDIWEADGVEGLSERLVRADTLRRERENGQHILIRYLPVLTPPVQN